MEAPDFLTRVGQKCRRSSEPAADTERHGHEYYLRPTLDVLEATMTSRQWIEQRSVVFKNSLAQLESLAAAVGFLACPASV